MTFKLGGFRIVVAWDATMSCFRAKLDPEPAVDITDGVGNTPAQAVETLERNISAWALFEVAITGGPTRKPKPEE